MLTFRRLRLADGDRVMRGVHRRASFPLATEPQNIDKMIASWVGRADKIVNVNYHKLLTWLSDE